MARLFREGDIGRDGFVVTVNLYHGYAMKSEVGQLVNADIAPLVCDKSCDIPKGCAFFGVVLGQIPCAWSKGIKQPHHENRCVFQLLGAKRVIAHFLGDGGNKACFLHRVEG